MRTRLALVLALALAPVLPAQAAPRLAPLGTARPAGAFWYSVTLAVPAKGAYETEARALTAKRAPAVCLSFEDRAGGAALRREWVYPARYGEWKPSNVFRCRDSHPAVRDARTVNLVMVLASARPVEDASVVVRGSRGVRILAEAWGSARMLDERDFGREDGAAARAGNALLMAGSSVEVRYERAAFALMRTPGSYALLSLTGPGGETEFHNGTAGLGGKGPGLYRFGVEALGAATSEGPDRAPFVLLVTADADFPACSRLSVAGTAPDGHPVCATA